jgi:hypothetical protein
MAGLAAGRCDLICRTVGHVNNLIGVDANKQELFLDELAFVCQKHRVAFELEKLEKLQNKKRKFEEVNEQIATIKEKILA